MFVQWIEAVLFHKTEKISENMTQVTNYYNLMRLITTRPLDRERFLLHYAMFQPYYESHRVITGCRKLRWLNVLWDYDRKAPGMECGGIL